MKLEKSQLTFSLNPTLGADGETKTFKGVAYSGDVIENHWYWGNLVFDSASIKFKLPLGALCDHEVDNRVGVVTDLTIGEQGSLDVAGHFMDNDMGNTIHREVTVEGYPWEMSVYIKPKKVVTYSSPVFVNGKTLDATPDEPLTVFYGGNIREVSFTPIGADGATSVEGFSDTVDGVEINVEKVQDNMTDATTQSATELAETKAQLQQFKDAAETANAELLKFKAAAHETNVNALVNQFSVTDAEVIAGFKAMTPDALATVNKFAALAVKPPEASIASLLTTNLQFAETTKPVAADADLLKTFM